MLCRSELAREKPVGTAFIQNESGVIAFFREQARSYRGLYAMSSRTTSKPVALPAPSTILIPALLLFISGMAALVYQVLWIKQL